MSEKDITNKQAEATMNPIVVDMNQRYQYLLLYIYNVSLIQSKSWNAEYVDVSIMFKIAIW